VRALVTGAAGFVGRHLCAALTAAGHETLATGLPADAQRAGVPAGTRWLDLDITDAAACRALLAAEQPGWVFHLAGFAHVGRAEAAPEDCLRVNFGGTRAVLEAALACTPRPRVLLVSSSEVYGRVPEAEQPVVEARPLLPSTVYAVSKAAAEMAGQHAAARGLPLVILRPFNHIGPGQSDDFVASAFAHQLARIESGAQEPVLRVGNLSAVRDLSDVRDVVAAYLRVAESGRAGETYNVTSGHAVAVSEILDGLRALVRVPVRVEVDPARLRPVDVPLFHGSGEKLFREVGVRIVLDLPRTLGSVLDYWRATETAAVPRR
jgi:GDP-4-dehydro-6-deoxy-D-mannose reductase